MARYKVVINEIVHTYENYEDIPLEFDHLILFEPDFPPGPHTQEEHDYIETFGGMLSELMSREKRCRL